MAACQGTPFTNPTRAPNARSSLLYLPNIRPRRIARELKESSWRIRDCNQHERSTSRRNSRQLSRPGATSPAAIDASSSSRSARNSIGTIRNGFGSPTARHLFFSWTYLHQHWCEWHDTQHEDSRGSLVEHKKLGLENWYGLRSSS